MNKKLKLMNESIRSKYERDVDLIKEKVKEELGLTPLIKPDGFLNKLVISTGSGELQILVNLGYAEVGDNRYKIPGEIEELVKEIGRHKEV